MLGYERILNMNDILLEIEDQDIIFSHDIWSDIIKVLKYYSLTDHKSTDHINANLLIDQLCGDSNSAEIGKDVSLYITNLLEHFMGDYLFVKEKAPCIWDKHIDLTANNITISLCIIENKLNQLVNSLSLITLDSLFILKNHCHLLYGYSYKGSFVISVAKSMLNEQCNVIPQKGIRMSKGVFVQSADFEIWFGIIEWYNICSIVEVYAPTFLEISCCSSLGLTLGRVTASGGLFFRPEVRRWGMP
jgi:hypothetical protein